MGLKLHRGTKAHQCVQLSRRGTGVDGALGERDRAGDVIRFPCGDQRGSRIEQDNVTPRRFVPAQYPANDASILERVATRKILERGTLESELFRLDFIRANRAVASLR